MTLPLSDRTLSLSAPGLIAAVVILLMFVIQGCSSPPLEHWHTERLTEEFTADMLDDQVSSFDEYLALEQRLFTQLDEKVYAKTGTGPEHALQRYSRGSMADPTARQPDWNRSFELSSSVAVGGVLLLHGMSDSPYSLRALGEALSKQGYLVVGLRAPGHGTAPSGLRYASWQDMAAAVKLGMRHLSQVLGSKPLHIIGYSTGASLALDYALEALEDDELMAPSSLVLISPAIRVHSAAAIAGFKDALSAIPGLDSLAYLAVMDEFDPYKFNSFATNAGAQVHRVTSSVDRRIREMSAVPGAVDRLPPLLVLKSAVDSTVTTDAVVDNLLIHFSAGRNELVLFDINRNSAVKSTLMVSDPGPLTIRLLNDGNLPFALSVVTNEHEHSTDVVLRHKDPYSAKVSQADPLGLAWPREVISLSHVALPFPPDDPVYGRYPPEDNRRVYLGFLGLKGEQGLLSIPAAWLLRMRYNPFYPYLESRVIGWLDETGS